MNSNIKTFVAFVAGMSSMYYTLNYIKKDCKKQNKKRQMLQSNNELIINNQKSKIPK